MKDPLGHDDVPLASAPPLTGYQIEMGGMAPAGQPMMTAYAVPQPQMAPTYIGQPPMVMTAVAVPAQAMQSKPSEAITAWGPFPIRCTCCHCKQDVTTTVTPKTVGVTHLVALALCVCGWWPCALIPYCSKTCKGTRHTCPACKRELGLGKPDLA